MDGKGFSHAIVYGPEPLSPDEDIFGHYAFDTTLTAIHISRRNGKPSGLLQAFYPDGSLLIRAVYGWGSLHGDWTEYDEDGVITVKGQYRDGLRDGRWTFRKDGIRARYRKGLKHGKWKYYDGKTITKVEKYFKGELKQGGTFLFKNR
jgi:antitoxin component YwqK of YwqJK toxin-antitoxin module